MSSIVGKHVSERRCLQSRRSRILLTIVVSIVICAAIIPAVVVTTLQKNSMGPKSKIFVPLYVYPARGAWSPLEDVYVSSFSFSPSPPIQEIEHAS